MKKGKKLARQCLVLLLAVTMCFGLLNTTSFAVSMRAEVSGPETAKLCVIKVVDNGGEPLTPEQKAQKFHFTVVVSGFIDGGTRTYEFDLSAADGPYWIEDDLPIGLTYTVTETPVEGYVSSGTVTGTIEPSGSTVTYTNKVVEPETGGLTVKKTVVNEDGSALTDEQEAQEFTFTVTLSDDSIDGDFGDMTFVSGVATFKLKDGESKTATGLPDGITYTVTETPVEGYKSSGTVTGKIEADQTKTAAFTNTKPGDPPGDPDPDPETPKTGGLTVTKTVVNRSGELTDALLSKSFTFTVTLTPPADETLPEGKQGTYTFTLRHGETWSIDGLPVGTTYAVTEAAAEGYTSGSTGANGTIPEGTATAAFTNTTWTELPDPNDPDSPDEITIIEDGVPKSFEKVWDDEEEEWVYIPEDDVPRVPMTGDPFNVWPYVTILSAAGLFYLLVIEPKKAKKD